MRVLITGSNGQLGSEIKELTTKYSKLDFIFKDLQSSKKNGATQAGGLFGGRSLQNMQSGNFEIYVWYF